MRKIIFVILAFFFAGITTMNAQDPSKIRIYLNPGHGSWGPEDRPMATIPYPNTIETGRPDTCGFYESNTNLWKTLALRDKLVQYGFQKKNIVHSRTQTGPYPYVPGAPDEEKYNRNLTEICEEVEAGNFDMFVSVHSNSADEGQLVNYPLFLFRGYDNGSTSAHGSKEMCKTVWPYLMSNGIDLYTHYTDKMNVRGDIDFYGSKFTHTLSNGKSYTGYLGVLKHGVPGFLCEGYFHTYQPARHRALNRDYCSQEGVRYFRGIIHYYNLPDEKVGYIMGTVKDGKNKISHPLFNYINNSNDQWFPINGATVKLFKDGKEISEYHVDKNYNGVFVFSELEPGEYTIECSAPHYDKMESRYSKVIVKANQTTYPKVLLNPEKGFIPSILAGDEKPEAKRNYAYLLKHSVNSDKIHDFAFYSTGDAKSATITLKDTVNNTKTTFSIDSIKCGKNNITIKESDIPDGTFSWSVNIENYELEKASVFFRLNKTNSGSGVAVNTNPESECFGQTYFSDGYESKSIYSLTPALDNNKCTKLFNRYFKGEENSPGRLAINPNDNNVYISDNHKSHSGIYYFSPSSSTARLMTFFRGRRSSNGTLLGIGSKDIIGGQTIGICFQGKGKDTKLYAFEANCPTNGKNNLCRYDVGTANNSWKVSPSAVLISASSLMLNGDVCLAGSENGIFMAQTRYAGNNTSKVPVFTYLRSDGKISFNSGTGLRALRGCKGSGIAVSKDYKNLAIVDENANIKIYSISWNYKNDPIFRLKANITNTSGNIKQMAFDYADNLFVSARNGNYAIALPSKDLFVETKANEVFNIGIPSAIGTPVNKNDKLSTSVDNGVLTIECSEQTKSIRIYSPDGICIARLIPENGRATIGNMHPGVYIVKAGNKTAKVLVK